MDAQLICGVGGGTTHRLGTTGFRLGLFPLLMSDLLPLIEFGGKTLASPLPQRLLDESARVSTLRTDEALGFDRRLAVRRHDHFDDFAHAAPPLTWMVSLIEPSASGCSVTV